jgi:uncharacterized protein (DUF1800 family)
MPTWNEANARHLLSRCLFGYSREDLSKALSYSSVQDFVDKELLADTQLPNAPGAWITEELVANDPNQGTRYRDFTYWWYQLMLNEKTSMREKMVLFLHNHFTSQRSKVTYPQHMYQQQALFRKYVFGDMRALTKEITVDSAMLIYLDGNGSNGNQPNENYARELLELFTIGIGNYTETDIKQAAKALSGWRVRALKPTFDNARYYTGNITFLGETGRFDYQKVVDIIFTKDATAEFFCKKLYKEFMYYQPDVAFVKKMAKIMRDNSYQLKPVLRFMLTSDEFYDTKIIGAKIRNPTEVMIGTLKAFELKTTDWAYVFDMGRILQQYLLEPPDVAGWAGQREFISSTTYAYRLGFTDSIINGKRANGQVLPSKPDALKFARSFKSAEDAVALVDDIAKLLIRFPLSAQKKDYLLQTLLDGTIVSNWATSTPMADARIQRLLKAAMKLPEYQLC